MQTHSSALAATLQPTAPVLDIGSLPLQLEDLTRERIKSLPKPAHSPTTKIPDAQCSMIAPATSGKNLYC